MPKTTADAKAVLLRGLLQMYQRNPGAAYSCAELAGELGCSPRTVLRYIDELGASGQLPTYKDDEHRYRLVEGGRVPLAPLGLDLREGTALYLAARLLAQQTDERNEHVMSALRQLVAVMPPALTGQLERLVTATALAQPRAPDVTEIFSTLVEGWAQQRLVALRYRPYRPPHSAHAFECRLAPYLIEPSAIGRTIYVIGATSPRDELRTFKLERIERATLLHDRFTIPADFDGPALLARAWGVMYGDEQPVMVRLRFSRFVARRVRETRWHPSQRIEDLPDGGCEWEALIGDILEIGPWVRGWGSDCEVMDPAELRDDVVRHVRRMARDYGLAEAPSASDERIALDDIFG